MIRVCLSHLPIALQVISPLQNLFYGNAGDSLYSHNEIPFSTFDVDNDNRDGDFGERSCARLYKVRELGCLDSQVGLGITGVVHQ